MSIPTINRNQSFRLFPGLIQQGLLFFVHKIIFRVKCCQTHQPVVSHLCAPRFCDPGAPPPSGLLSAGITLCLCKPSLRQQRNLRSPLAAAAASLLRFSAKVGEISNASDFSSGAQGNSRRMSDFVVILLKAAYNCNSRMTTATKTIWDLPLLCIKGSFPSELGKARKQQELDWQTLSSPEILHWLLACTLQIGNLVSTPAGN